MTFRGVGTAWSALVRILAHTQYNSHSAIVIETGQDSSGRYLLAVGGNESNSIGKKEVHLTAGLVKQRTTSSFISVVQNLK